ncbi:hypothetical protein C5C08_10240 [Rathayibacter rathayi]|nr:hypothetical protein C1O28_11160 [Rathayibacter rathayi]PPF47916.1 hypothetical protein C5C08_10240 [Rathayibacter rathayi]PPG67824.1 hypothetical protein C5C16_08665 [Rathayibacter rathayi]PPG79485.1 hypothetical protein C5C15_06260 [Rathayibacter rathayi]PPG88081.1 hypothetical protein C5C47_08330 [Rathayibacter rathayi]
MDRRRRRAARARPASAVAAERSGAVVARHRWPTGPGRRPGGRPTGGAERRGSRRGHRRPGPRRCGARGSGGRGRRSRRRERRSAPGPREEWACLHAPPRRRAPLARARRAAR